jgi:luciferase family oxidoreductase group 1
MMEPSGVGLSVAGRTHALKATPVARTVPTIWLLGSSDYSARLAAEKGMPYVFAHHFSGSGTAEALELYRSSFRPSPELAQPRTFLTVNAVVAESAEEAERRALPNLLMMVALRTGAPLGPQLLVEEAEKIEVPDAHRPLIDAMRSRWVIGDPDSARAQLESLAATYAVDEVMVHPVAAAHVGTDPTLSPAREETLRTLARQFRDSAAD